MQQIQQVQYYRANLLKHNGNTFKVQVFPKQNDKQNQEPSQQYMNKLMQIKNLDKEFITSYQNSLQVWGYENPNYQHLKQFLSLIYQSLVRVVRLNKVAMGIIKQICCIDFQNMVCLNLNDNNIDNIEMFAYLKTPVLTTLQLYNNNIVNLSPIGKNRMLKKLGVLTLYKNQIKEIKKLYRSFLPSLNYFQLETHSSYPVISEDLSFSFKLPQIVIENVTFRLWAQSKDRVKSKQILALMRKKVFVKNYYVKQKDPSLNQGAYQNVLTTW